MTDPVLVLEYIVASIFWATVAMGASVGLARVLLDTVAYVQNLWRSRD